MLVLNLRAFENKEYAAYDRFHGNGPYGEIPTKKEPIRTLGFAVPYNKYILLTKREGRSGRISARGLDSTKRTEGRYSPNAVPSKLGERAFVTLLRMRSSLISDPTEHFSKLMYVREILFHRPYESCSSSSSSSKFIKPPANGSSDLIYNNWKSNKTTNKSYNNI